MEKIREHVLRQAREEAEALVAAAREEAQRRVAAARERTERDLQRRLARFHARLEREHRQALDRIAFEHRLEALRLKRGILEAVFREAKERFIASPRYRDWLRARLAAAGATGGEVLCNERDRALCRTILQHLAREGGTELALAGEPPAADAPAGGVVVRTERFDLDLSLDAALEELRERVMPDLIALAFSGVEERGDAGG